MGWSDFRDCFPLHVQIDSGVFVGSIGTGMTEPASDVGEINTGLEKVDGCAMPDTVRMETLTPNLVSGVPR